MRIICVEEHVGDPQIARATQAAMAAQAPYMAGVGTRYRDDLAHEATDRPRLVAMKAAMAALNGPLEARLTLMDAAGMDMQVLSQAGSPQLAPAAGAADLARGANDRLAEAVSRRPDRFGAFFTLPWQDPQAAVREAERCVRDLGLCASLITGRPAVDAMLDDARYEPVLAALAALDAPLYVHPGAPMAAVQQPYYAGFEPEVTARLSLFGWGWHNEAGVQVLRLVLGGALDRHRGLKLISGHWGEMVTFFLQRLDDTLPPAATGLERTISQTYRDQVWVTPSGMLNLPHLLFIRDVLGMDRVLFSVDYPFLTLGGARTWLEDLPLTETEKSAFAHANAEALLRIVR